jgi:hypothetical protein
MNEQIPIYYRQGDILLEPIKDLDLKNLRPLKNNIIEEGEISGHRHWLDTSHQAAYEDERGTKYVHLIDDTVLVQGGEDEDPVWLEDEAQKKGVHIAHILPPGAYIVLREHDLEGPSTNRTIPVKD